MSRKRIIADYDRRLGADGKETYIYTGPRYTFDIPEEQLARYRIVCWLVPIVCVALFAVMGMLNTDGTRAFYIVLPYVFLFLPLALMIGDAYKISVAPRQMERKEYARSVVQLRRCTIATIALSAYVSVAQALYMLLGSSTTPRQEILFFVCAVAICAINLFFMQAQKRAKVTERR